MRKIFALAIIAFALTVTSCGSNGAECANTENCDSTCVKPADSAVVESTVVDTTVVADTTKK